MRVWKHGNGPKPWRARGNDARGRKVQRSFATRGQAEEFDRKFEETKARERAGLEIERPNITIAELATLYLENQPERKSDRWFKAMLKHTLDEFGERRVRDPQLSVDYGRWLHALGSAPKTKTSILSTARQILAAGVEWGYITRNPLRPSAVRGPGTKRVTPIQPFESFTEVRAVAAACEKHSRVILFLALTGLRPGELLALTWNHWTSNYLSVPGTKTEAAERVIPICKPARNLLASLPRPIDSTQPIFAMDWNDWRDNEWKDALENVGLPYRPPYELRHTFATLALEQGVPIEALSKLLGHTDIAITLRYYAKFTRRKLEQDVALLDNILEAPGHLADTK